VVGRLVADTGQEFDYELFVPVDWAGRYVIEEHYGTAGLIHDPGEENLPEYAEDWRYRTIFGVLAISEAAFQESNDEACCGILEKLLEYDGTMIACDGGTVANPYWTEEDAELTSEFQEMGGLVREIVHSLRVTPLP